MKIFNFSANGIDFGNFEAETKNEAQDKFAVSSGYLSWEDMIEIAKEFGGNTVEILEITA